MKQIIASVFLYPCRGYYDFHKVYIFLIIITRRVDLAMSVRFYSNLSLSFKAIGLKLSQKSYFFCR